MHGGLLLFLTNTEVHRQENRSKSQKDAEKLNIRHLASPHFLLL